MDIIFDRELVERRRIRAGKRSEPADFLLDVVAEELAPRLAAVERRFDRAVELHGGTGKVGTACLATGRIGQLERIESIDLGLPGPTILAPVDDLPLQPDSTNLVISPLALHMVNDLPGMFVRIRRALKADGLFLAAIPGAGTLTELRESLLAADAELHGGASPRVIPFADIRAIGALLQRAGFALPVVDAETYTVRYDSLFNLMADLRAMGMTNVLADRSRKPETRAFFLKAAEIYAKRFSDADGRIRASFSVIYVSGWAPHESQQKPLRPGSAKMRLAEALDPEKGNPPE